MIAIDCSVDAIESSSHISRNRQTNPTSFIWRSVPTPPDVLLKFEMFPTFTSFFSFVGRIGSLHWLSMIGGSCRLQDASSTLSATTCTLDLSAKVLTTSKTLSHKKCFLPGPTWKPLTSCEGDYLRFYSPPMPSVTKEEAQDRLWEKFLWPWI